MIKMNLVYRGGCKVENCASDIDGNIPNFRYADISNTLLARDYKGIANTSSNAVIEIFRIEETNEV